MDQTLKEKILKLFQDNEDICVDYSLFLDSKADTEFVGCTGKEKKKYWDIFQHMEQKAPGTKIVIHIYDEEDGRWFADDAYLETSLSEEDLKGIFEKFNEQYEGILCERRRGESETIRIFKGRILCFLLLVGLTIGVLRCIQCGFLRLERLWGGFHR